jgi:hypothetical protein
MTNVGQGRFVAVVGAPRSGTTSLSDFLKRHRDVTFSAVKEPHFFSQFDLNPCSDAELADVIDNKYVSPYFPHRTADTSVLAEGSVTYLYRPQQMVPILRAWPEAKFVIAVRDPMEMLPSLHRRLLYLGDEVVTDFAKAWELVADRQRGLNIPRSCVNPYWLRYDEAGRLGKYVDEFISVVGQDRCFIVLFDDLVADPAATYRRLLEFVGLPFDGRSDFAPQRVGRGYKNATLQRLLKRPPHFVRAALAGEHSQKRIKRLEPHQAIGSRLSRTVMAARKRLLQWNHASVPPTYLDPSLRQEIRERLTSDIDRLASLIGRDLSHWLAVESAATSSPGP